MSKKPPAKRSRIDPLHIDTELQKRTDSVDVISNTRYTIIQLTKMPQKWAKIRYFNVDFLKIFLGA